MCDLRTRDNQINSVPVEKLWELLPDPFAIDPILTPELATELIEKHEAKFMIIDA